MPLAIPSGGDSKPYIKFLASLNSWQMSGEAGAQEFNMDKPVVFDLANIQLGWLWLAEGMRDWQPWPDNKQIPKPAEGEYKAGFDVQVMSTQMFGGEPVRAFASNGTGAVMFIQALYAEAEKHPEFEGGLSPVVQITNAKPLKVGKGNTRVPQFNIVKWVPRPAAFDGGAAAPAAAAPAPKAKPAPAPAPATADDEF